MHTGILNGDTSWLKVAVVATEPAVLVTAVAKQHNISVNDVNVVVTMSGD